ncbi:MAG TPA: AI-2E family transporter [Planctomycetaceae bacterium]|nr:AI-2E family transporter [Planctomycetaceae bacterium]
MPRLVSLAVLAVLIVCLGLAFVHVIAPFLLPMFLAAMLAIICQPAYKYFLSHTGNRPPLAAGLTTLSVMSAIILPILVITILGALQLYAWAVQTIDSQQFAGEIERMRAELQIDKVVERIQPLLGEHVDAEEIEAQIRANIKSVSVAIAERTWGVASSAFGLVGTILYVIGAFAIMLISLYFFLADGPAFLAATEELVPLRADYQERLFVRFVKVVRAVVISTFAAAVTQGVATGLALMVCGFPRFILLTIIATLTALIPLAGTWLVWGPCALWLAWHGHYWTAGLLAAWGIIVVGTLDNVVRAWLLHSDVRLHPLLAFISVLGGLQWLGLWGVFIGPIVASCLHALVEIFNTELKLLAEEKSQATVAPATGATPPVAVVPVSVEVAQVTATQVVQTAPAAQPSAKVVGNSRRSRRKQSRSKS